MLFGRSSARLASLGQALKLCLGTIVLFGSSLRSAAAEGFVDVYLGAGQPRNTVTTAKRVQTVSLLVPPIVTTEARRADFDTSVAFGVRVGQWRMRRPRLGWAFDLSRWYARSRELDASILAPSASVMSRWNIEDAPRLTPYVGVGASLFYTDLTADFRPAMPETLKLESEDLGYNIQAGLSWRLRSGFTILVEYRLARASEPIDARHASHTIDFFPEVTNSVQTRLEVRQLLAGLSFRF